MRDARDDRRLPVRSRPAPRFANDLELGLLVARGPRLRYARGCGLKGSKPAQRRIAVLVPRLAGERVQLLDDDVVTLDLSGVERLERKGERDVARFPDPLAQP